LNSSSTAAEGSRDPYQASQQYSQRQPVHGFEPMIVFGTKIETINQFHPNQPPIFVLLRINFI